MPISTAYLLISNNLSEMHAINSIYVHRKGKGYLITKIKEYLEKH